ncbi:MAG: hypothetical protein HZC37_10565 [Burkholderiales bacterium]|nr:hypothetical protein [Burkholderiales bacterium]
MPYYVYAVRPFAQLECLGEHAAFRDASARAKALRAERAEQHAASGGAPPAERIRVMFAETALAAEDLLLQSREPPPPGDE